MTKQHNLGSIALAPYWLTAHPVHLYKSDHSWWFEPIGHYDTIIFAGPFIENGSHRSITQNIITAKTHGLSWSILDIQLYLSNNWGINLRDISMLWHVIEASATCRVRDLPELACPLIAVIADTHHLAAPISSLLMYLRCSQYTHLTCTHNQHTPFFAAAIDIPTFSFPYTYLNAKKCQRELIRKKDLIYYGNLVSSHHVFRTKFINKILSCSSLRLGGRLSFHRWLDALAQGGQCVFTCSLNGSFSFQTLMPLLHRNAIITDPICSANWLGKLLPYLPDCHVFHDLEECLNIVQYIETEDSDGCTSKIEALTSELLKPFLSNQKILRNAFCPGKFYPEVLPDASTDSEKWLLSILTTARRKFGLVEVERMIKLYEIIQEQHRIHWRIGITSITEMSKKSLIYDAFLMQMPTMLPRLKYPDPQGIHVQDLEVAITS
ncbi:hypothetical protein KBY58_06715 [Cyanobium sp. HWJ4-Hawea]|uniref:hypothetical protein n=1 Tax=Cyanobium sp. HWJ4-Hawea TaxID=2823713 RepID=UPI0020CC911B|nr:hypothetical protein [Cyanobium sp. HWJ4-Hawea]MCP9809122.1 hypothetical protein [Cyanobium sp. HWJ4-Hawea]